MNFAGMFRTLRTRSSAVTLDVGSSGIRACQVLARGREAWVNEALRIDVARDSQTGNAASTAKPSIPSATGETAENTDFACARDADRVRRMVEQGGFGRREVALVLSPPDVRFHTLRVPDNVLRQPEERIRAALAFEVAREARCEPHELEVRHWPLPAGHQQGMNVMAVSLPARRAAELVESFGRRRLSLCRLDASPCALVRLALQSWTPGPRDLWAVLECGFRQSVLTVVLGDQPAYVRSFPISADQLTRRVADAFELSYSEAEELKRRHGVAPADDTIPADGPVSPDAANLAGVLFGLLREPLDALVREVDLCCSYVMRSYTDASVNRVVLAGGGAGLHGLREYLNLHLGVPVDVLSGSALAAHRTPRATDTLARPDMAAVFGGALLDLEAA